MKQITHHTPTEGQAPPSIVQAPQAAGTGAASPMTAVIGGVLQGGVIVSSAVILIGLLMLLLRGQLSERYLATFPHTFAQVWAGLLELHPQAVIALGLILLILTPVMRVAISIIAFAIERDRLYVVITTLVLLILIAGFLLQKGGA